MNRFVKVALAESVHTVIINAHIHLKVLEYSVLDRACPLEPFSAILLFSVQLRLDFYVLAKEGIYAPVGVEDFRRVLLCALRKDHNAVRHCVKQVGQLLLLLLVHLTLEVELGARLVANVEGHLGHDQSDESCRDSKLIELVLEQIIIVKEGDPEDGRAEQHAGHHLHHIARSQEEHGNEARGVDSPDLCLETDRVDFTAREAEEIAVVHKHV